MSPPTAATALTRIEVAGECFGTWLLLFLRLSTGAAAVTTGAQVGLWQVAVVWGFVIAVAIFVTSQFSGAHLNPAFTIAFAFSPQTKFPATRVLPYVTAQLIGGICGMECASLSMAMRWRTWDRGLGPLPLLDGAVSRFQGHAELLGDQ
ncbi:hypothetical protein PINS_up008898 [Pythium insidiosum]|nr:hypothetical protein PINS_up008898 [Pythium insidiosum]